MSAEDPTAAELLQQCNVAILALLTGKVTSYSLGGVSYTYHEIEALKRVRDQLRAEVAAASGRNSILLADLSG